MPPKGSRKAKPKAKATYGKARTYSKTKFRGYGKRKSYSKKRSYKRKPSYKKGSYKRTYKRRALPGGTGKTIGSYRRNLNVNLSARRELGMLRSTTPGRLLQLSLTAATPAIYSLFFVSNSTNVGLINSFLPTSVQVLPPTGLVEEVYSKFYNAMVMYNKIGIRLTRTDANKAYGAIKLALTPIQYSDYSSCLTATPSPTTTWVGSTPTLKFANQCDMPHTIVRNMVGGSSDALNSAYISSSVRPDYLYNQPGWQLTADPAVFGRLGFSEQNGTPIALACTVVWVLSIFHESPTTTDTSIIALDIHETWKLKAWDAVPAFLISENKQRALDAIVVPTKRPLVESKEESKFEMEPEPEWEDAVAALRLGPKPPGPAAAPLGPPALLRRTVSKRM